MELEKLYYQPDRLWSGRKAIKELQKLSGLFRSTVKAWLARQAIWQVSIPPPKKVLNAHYDVHIPNNLHQFDLLYMPADHLYRNVYKYILTGVDVASRFKVARPLHTKQAKEFAEMISDIYKKGPLIWPEKVMLDDGNEFKGDVTKLLQKHGVKIDRAVTKYHHEHTAFVENLNKELQKSLFKPQDAQELNDREKVSTIWVKYLYDTVDKMNNRVTKMTGLKPEDAIKMAAIKIVHKQGFPKEKLLPESGLYRYLLQPGEEQADQRRRVTDFRWSKKEYRLSKIVEDPGNRVLYYLEDGPEHGLVREELMLIPEDTQDPPDSVQKW